ncbi:MAG TPA: gluconate 2-dehydrogenase subunit 3 family protein [Candidatus Binatia bacterium]|nr:gluconate 2-dehydrogenase subunit 3 family protein [Candidatus Binatia bacterium]
MAAGNNVQPSRDAETALAAVRGIFRAFVTTIVPEAASLDAKGWHELEGLVNDMLRDRPASLQRQLRLLLRAVEWLPVLRFGRPFTALDAAQRTRVLSYLQNHRLQLIRTGFWGLRTLAFAGYYGRAEAAREIGYAANRRGWEAVR